MRGGLFCAFMMCCMASVVDEHSAPPCTIIPSQLCSHMSECEELCKQARVDECSLCVCLL